ncbi:hypothetical protein GCM10009862_02940 [Microbacterium binotii]|uniref:Uncharacterized protein n=1 Tax=Microbacterium binotii TaxID=462710 RepID=A0ABN3P6X5_9MICO
MTLSVVAAFVAATAIAAVIIIVSVLSAGQGPSDGASPDGSASATPSASGTTRPVEQLPTPTPLASTPAPTDRQPAEVVLATWGASGSGIEASAYVAGVVEDGGSCSLHARQGDTERTVEAAATPTGQNVSCGFATVPASDLSAGDWEIWFTYASPTHEGTSSAVSVTFGGQQ